MARTCHRSRATGRRGGLGPGRMVWAARAASQRNAESFSNICVFFSYQKQRSAVMREGLFFIFIFIMSLKLARTTIKEYKPNHLIHRLRTTENPAPVASSQTRTSMCSVSSSHSLTCCSHLFSLLFGGGVLLFTKLFGAPAFGFCHQRRHRRVHGIQRRTVLPHSLLETPVTVNILSYYRT